MNEVIVQPKKKSNVLVEAKPTPSISIQSPRVEVSKEEPKEGIAYPPKRWSSIRVSTRFGDEGWRYANEDFVRVNPENPEYYQDLDYEANDPFFTLKYPNIFGNHNRITDLDGDQVYPQFSGHLIPFYDHLQGAVFVLNQTHQLYDDHVIAAHQLSLGGFDKFEVANSPELMDLQTRLDYNSFLSNPTHPVQGQILVSTIDGPNVKRIYSYDGDDRYTNMLVAPSSQESAAYYIQYLDK